MRPLSAGDILALWETGATQHPLDRAITLLAATTPGLSRSELSALPIEDRDRRLLEWREPMFGPSLECVATCPECGESVEFQLHTHELLTQFADTSSRPVALSADGWEWSMRMPDSRDLASIATVPDHRLAYRALVERCIVSIEVNGRCVDPATLPDEAIERLSARFSEVEPHRGFLLDVACPACGHTWSQPFDVGDFIWTELSAEVRRLLRDVDALARAYGWSETEILALTPSRRAAYLELVSE